MNKLYYLFGAALLFSLFYQQRTINTLREELRASQKAEFDSEQIIGKLATDVQLNYLDEFLGKPVFINFSKNGQYKELIYIEDDFYAQIISDMRDKVLAYAVTMKDKEFQVPIEVAGKEIVLNKSTFSSINDELSKANNCYHFLGNTAPSYYFQEHYLGNPGKYQTYLFGINSAAEGSDLPKSDRWGTTECQAIDLTSLDKSMPNTFMVLSPEISVEELNLARGINSSSEFGFGINRVQLRLVE